MFLVPNLEGTGQMALHHPCPLGKCELSVSACDLFEGQGKMGGFADLIGVKVQCECSGYEDEFSVYSG